SGSGANYTVSVTGMNGTGTVVATIPAGGAKDLAGNLSLAATFTDNVVSFDNVPPTVTITKSSGQPDPVTANNVNFDVVFSEPVIGFTSAGISFAGSTVGGTPTATITGSG